MYIPEMEQNNEKKFLLLKTIAFELGIKNSHNPEKDTCQWHSMCYEKPLWFNIWLREIFSKSCSLRVMKKYDQNGLMEILQEFGTP